MVKILAPMNSEHLDKIYTPSPNILKSYMKEHNKDHSWVIQIEDMQLNSGTHTARKSNMFHLQIFMNTTINLVSDGHQVLNS